MRILHILDHSLPLQSGYVFRTLSILEHQRKLGWETFHVTTPKQTTPYAPLETVDGWEFYRTPPVQGPWARIPVWREMAEMGATARRLSEVIGEVKPDILHAHSPVLNAIPALRAKRKSGIPVVYELRALWEDAGVSHGTHVEWGLRYRAIRALETYALRRVDRVATICEGLKEEIESRGVPRDRITVVPNAINLDACSGAVERDVDLAGELGLADMTVLGFVGSFYRYEGLHVLMEAMPRIIARAPDVRLLLVGGGFEEENLKQQAARLGLAHNVVFTGRVHHGEVQKYYALIDLLVYPRLKIRLTDLVTPLKPLEAMAQKKILMASDIGGHNELIRDGETGILFPAGDPDALADTALEVMGNRDRWPEIRENGRRFVEAERSWAKVVVNYRGVYAELTES